MNNSIHSVIHDFTNGHDHDSACSSWNSFNAWRIRSNFPHSLIASQDNHLNFPKATAYGYTATVFTRHFYCFIYSHSPTSDWIVNYDTTTWQFFFQLTELMTWSWFESTESWPAWLLNLIVDTDSTVNWVLTLTVGHADWLAELKQRTH